jgi:hypothetical protein
MTSGPIHPTKRLGTGGSCFFDESSCAFIGVMSLFRLRSAFLFKGGWKPAVNIYDMEEV